MILEEPAVAYERLSPLKKVDALKGKAKVIPVYQWSSYDKIDAIKGGITKEELESLKNQSGLDYDTLAVILNVAKATLHNKKGKAKFDQYISERIFLLADVYSYGYKVFEQKEKFNQWMKTDNRSLGNIKPLSLLDTMYGVEEIKHLIGRIEYGVYS
ncbi:MAG: antitoxin Xre/MbcA/ParS toxin-binding domain-containing protein [Bacteroidota bacterium]